MVIVGIQCFMIFGEYIINIFFYCLWCVYLLVWYLLDYYISLEKVLYFCFDIVVVVGVNDVDIMFKVVQCVICDFGQGVVQLIIGVGEFFCVVDNQGVVYFLILR